MDPKRAGDDDVYRRDMEAFLSHLAQLAFGEHGLNRLFAETWAFREFHISVLEGAGFTYEGRLREHTMDAGGRPIDSVLHSRLASEWRGVSGWGESAVLVTGGAGVIGRELIASLTEQGARVLCADLKPRPDWLDSRVEYEEGDANELTPDRVQEFAPTHVFHLAATFERTEETEGFWEENDRHNVRLSHHIATLARHTPSVRRYVFASSYLTYDPALYLFGEPRAEPNALSEDDPVRPRNLCGGAKLLHEEELDFLAPFDGTPFTSVSARIFRVYGRGSKDVVSRWVRALIEDPARPLAAFRIEGMFDYVFAGDVAEGLLRLGASDATGAVNLGSGRARRVSELLELLRRAIPRRELGRGALGDRVRSAPGRSGAAGAHDRMAPSHGARGGRGPAHRVRARRRLSAR